MSFLKYNFTFIKWDHSGFTTNRKLTERIQRLLEYSTPAPHKINPWQLILKKKEEVVDRFKGDDFDLMRNRPIIYEIDGNSLLQNVMWMND